MRFRFKIRTLLIVVTVVAILIAYLARISTIENRRRYFVSDAYWYEIGTASIDSYVSHSETHSLSWSRWIGTKLAGTGEETTAISVGFGADAEADEIKEVLSLFPEVQYVHFHHTKANPANIALLSNLPELLNIQIDEGIADIETMTTIGKLQQRPTVSFHNIHLDDSFLNNAVVSKIDLCSVYSPTSSVTDAGMQSVSKFEKFIFLTLKDCQISNEGVKELKGHASLIGIFMDNCPVGDPCVETLITMPNLLDLSLRGTDITDVGIEALLPIAGKMRNIDIRETAVTPEAIKRLNLKCRMGALKFTPPKKP